MINRILCLCALLNVLFANVVQAIDEDTKPIEERYLLWEAPGDWGGVYESTAIAASFGCASWEAHYNSIGRVVTNCGNVYPDANEDGSFMVSLTYDDNGISKNGDFNLKLLRQCTEAPYMIEALVDDDNIIDRCGRPDKCDSSNNKEGNPISCNSGQKIQNDIVYQGSGFDPLSYSINYSSPILDDEDNQLNSFASGLGNQRFSSLNKKLEVVYSKNGGQIVKMSWGNGNYRYYYSSNSLTKLTGIGSSAKYRERNGYILANSDGSYQYTTKYKDILNFDGQGRLLSKKTANGLNRTYSYTATGKVESITNHYGKSLNFHYNQNDLLEKLVAPAGETYLFEYDSIGNMVKVIFPDDTPLDNSDNPFIEYLFEDTRFPRHLTAKINEKGVRFASWTYDEKGRAISSQHSGGIEKVEVDYSVDNQSKVKTFVNNSLSNEKIFHYQTDSAGRKKVIKLERLACSDCVVGDELYEYDGNGFESKVTSPNGTVVEYTKDDNGVQTKQVIAKGTPQEKQITTTWYSKWPKPNLITDGNLKTKFAYTSSTSNIRYKKLTDSSTGENRQTNYTFYSQGKLKTVDGPRTDKTDKTYYYYHSDGNLSRIKNALNHETYFDDYDDSGRVGKITDANGVITTLTYTPRGWLESRTTNGALTSYEYFSTGSVKKITIPNGTSISYEYDDGERLVAVVDSLGNRIEYVRDLMGNVTETKIKDSNGVLKRSQTAVFNALGQLTQSLGNHGQSTQLTYDAEGNPLTDKNALNNTMTSSFDALNRIKDVVDPDNGKTEYGYDDKNRITSVTDAEGKITSYEYNAFGDLTKLTSPDTGVTTFTFDKAGNILTKTDARGVTVTFTYDALNRVLTQSYSDASENITYTYDDTANGNKGIGRLTQVTDQSGSTSFVYDSFGNVSKETRVIEGQTYITEYHFDTNGEMTGMTYPSGRVLTYSFDALRRASGLTSTYQNQTKTLASNITYLPFGPMESLTYGNSKVLTQTFDSDYRLTGKSVTGISDLSYGYDLTNNITSISNTQNAANDETFTYDKLSRLLTANGGYGDLSFTYDKIGNRLSKTENTNTDSYNYANDSHRLTSITGANAKAFTHDAMGNTLTKDGLTFTYNQQGRMETAAKVGMNANYIYNFKGERSRKLVNGNGTHFIYNLQGQLIVEADTTGSITQEYIYLNGQRLASVNNGTLYYVHTSRLDAPLALTDETGVVQWQAHYTPFGEVIVDIDNVTQAARFPGQYLDVESGMYYNYFRDYDPEIGRYIQSDPIGLAGGINTYGYVHQNPVNRIDPTGLWSPEAHDALIRYAFKDFKCVSALDYVRAQAASRVFDTLTQAPNLNAYHSLLRPGQSAAEMESDRSNFIGQMSSGIAAMGSTGPGGQNREAAMILFGYAAHPIMDQYSPSHRNSDGSPATWDPFNPMSLLSTLSHSPNEWIGGETVDDITPEIYEKVRHDLRKLYKDLFPDECGCEE